VPSPYEEVFGDTIDSLHPRLRAYFGAIPAGSLGRGEGVFDVVGTPRRWLWPALWLVGRQGVLFAAWQRDVPFTVVNRPIVDAAGRTAVAAERTFHLEGGDRMMVDAITADAGHLVDFLGRSRRLEARLEATVHDGALLLRSTSLAVRIGHWRMRLPSAISPRVRLVERFDDGSDRQQVSVTVDAPLVGRLYEYSGSFRYEIRTGEAGS
jgi:hypothetical protein